MVNSRVTLSALARTYQVPGSQGSDPHLFFSWVTDALFHGTCVFPLVIDVYLLPLPHLFTTLKRAPPCPRRHAGTHPTRVSEAMDPSTCAAAELTARDEELRGECAKAFAHYKKGSLTRATELLQKLLARHPAHPLLHYAYTRLAHMQLLMARGPLAGIVQQFGECSLRVRAAVNACPHSLLPRLLCAQAYYDIPAPNEQSLEVALATLRAGACTRSLFS